MRVDLGRCGVRRGLREGLDERYGGLGPPENGDGDTDAEHDQGEGQRRAGAP
jgi:hypothetical protein